MKKIFLIAILITNIALAGIWVTPEFVGNAVSDSVVVSFCTFDTTFYPTIKDADSIIALRYAPDNTLLDSLTQTSSQLQNVREGWYEIHYRGSDGGGTQGTYRIYLRAKIGGDWRGAATASYQVMDDQLGTYFTSLVEDSDSLKDTLSVLMHKGDAVAVDSEAVARSVWNNNIIAQTDRRIGWSDTTGYTLGLPSTGGGVYPCTLFVVETTSQTAIEGVLMHLLNSNETATVAFGRTDSNGRLIFSLDNGSYQLYSYRGGYQFDSIPQSLTISNGGILDTVLANSFDPGNPPSAALCRVYGYIHSLGYDGLEEVVVTARILTTPLFYQGILISPYSVSTTTDTSGYWYLDIIPNELITPSGTEYDFTIFYESGTVLRKTITIPDSTSHWLSW